MLILGAHLITRTLSFINLIRYFIENQIKGKTFAGSNTLFNSENKGSILKADLPLTLRHSFHIYYLHT